MSRCCAARRPVSLSAWWRIHEAWVYAERWTVVTHSPLRIIACMTFHFSLDPVSEILSNAAIQTGPRLGAGHTAMIRRRMSLIECSNSYTVTRQVRMRIRETDLFHDDNYF